MLRAKWLLFASLILLTASACTAQYGDTRLARDSTDSGDYGDSNAYRYYAGPGSDVVPPLVQR
jgi:hypothetical protein